MSSMATPTPAKGAKAATGSPSTSTSAPVVRTGTLSVRERSAFGGRAWKSKGVVLDAKVLTIHQPSSNRQLRLPLSSITELERTDLMPHSLSIKCAGKVHHLAFDTDGDLYDWRDDIYSRCPLGAQTTSPFDFKHTAHIDSNGATGVFADPNTVPFYEQMVGRSIPTTGGMATSASPPPANSRARSAQTTTSRRRSNPLKGNIVLNVNNNVNIEGVYFIKQTGMFAGWYWKERWLSLKGDLLIVHTRKTKASPPAKEIPLSTIKSVEPDAKRSNSLLVTTTRRETCINILFDTDNDLYAWREAIYLRSGLSTVISTPTNFVHAMHVTFDPVSGEFKGLPDQWKSALVPAHSAHIVQLPIQPSNNAKSNGASRSSRRRSQPRAADLIQDNASPSKSPPLLSNHTRVPPLSSSADTQSSSVLAHSPDHHFLGGASSDVTLVSASPHNLAFSSGVKGKVDELAPLRE